VAATPRGILDLLLATLPGEQTGAYATDADGALRASMWVIRPHVTGMIRVSVSTYSGTPGKPPGTDNGNVLGNTTRSATGTVVQIGTDGSDCTKATNVTSYHPDGTLVEVDVATCLVDQDQTKTIGSSGLSIAEATAIADDPRWGVRISTSFNDHGATLPDVATFK
jgi:hypothetical protein